MSSTEVNLTFPVSSSNDTVQCHFARVVSCSPFPFSQFGNKNNQVLSTLKNSQSFSKTVYIYCILTGVDPRFEFINPADIVATSRCSFICPPPGVSVRSPNLVRAAAPGLGSCGGCVCIMSSCESQTGLIPRLTQRARLWVLSVDADRHLLLCELALLFPLPAASVSPGVVRV